MTLCGCTSSPLPRTDPLPVSAALSVRLEPAARVLDSAIAAGAAPGAVLAVSVHGEHFVHSIGQLAVDDPRPPDGRTLYDMASLTKVIATTTLAMMAVDENRLALDSPVVHYLPQFARGKGARSIVTVRDLLLHDSGLPPDPPPDLWKSPRHRESALDTVLATDLARAPGDSMVYSDINAIALATIIEKLYHKRIDELFAERVTRPLGLTRMRFLPPKSWHDEIASTELGDAPEFEGRHSAGRCMMRTPGGLVACRAMPDCSATRRICCVSANGRSPGHSDEGRRRVATADRFHHLDAAPGSSGRFVAWHRLGHSVRRVVGGNDHVIAKLRTHRLYRHVDLDRSDARDRDRAAHQPGQPDACHPKVSARFAAWWRTR